MTWQQLDAQAAVCKPIPCQRNFHEHEGFVTDSHPTPGVGVEPLLTSLRIAQPVFSPYVDRKMTNQPTDTRRSVSTPMARSSGWSWKNYERPGLMQDRSSGLQQMAGPWAFCRGLGGSR